MGSAHNVPSYHGVYVTGHCSGRVHARETGGSSATRVLHKVGCPKSREGGAVQSREMGPLAQQGGGAVQSKEMGDIGPAGKVVRWGHRPGMSLRWEVLWSGGDGALGHAPQLMGRPRPPSDATQQPSYSCKWVIARKRMVSITQARGEGRGCTFEQQQPKGKRSGPPNVPRSPPAWARRRARRSGSSRRSAAHPPTPGPWR